jgi:multidrug efflux pump subunit AcrA (membrane-fusion protein)
LTFIYKWRRIPPLIIITKITVTRIISRLKAYTTTLFTYGKQHPRKSAILVGVLLALLVVGSPFGGGVEDTPKLGTSDASVRLASVAVLSEGGDSLVLLGEVRSVSQAELRAEKSGEVRRVYVSAGQYVRAGAILAEIENGSERAGVLQAQGTLQAAQAALSKATAGARGEDKASASAQTTNADIALSAARDAARSAYSQSYSLAQNAVFAVADDYFSNPYTVNPSFRVRTADYDERQVLEDVRVDIGRHLDTWKESTLETIPNDMLYSKLHEA